MNKITVKYTKLIPKKLRNNTLYISNEYSTAVHLCACGCTNKVVTPFTSSDWSMIVNDEGVTLRPSIGNWYFSCQSHYWITDSRIQWIPERQVDDSQITNNILIRFIKMIVRKILSWLS